jgi:hypothetical protein
MPNPHWTFEPDEGINFGQLPVPGPQGIPLLTYGEYGGPGYTGGNYLPVGSASPPADYDVPPIDPLDALFRFHDIAYDPVLSGTEPLAQAQADVALIQGIARLPDPQLDAQASIYGGLATLGLIARVESGPYDDLLSDRQDLHYTVGALEDVSRGLHDLTPTEVAAATPYLHTIFDLYL